MLQSSPITLKLVAAISVVVFALWGLGPLMRQSRRLLLHVLLTVTIMSSFFQLYSCASNI